MTEMPLTSDQQNASDAFIDFLVDEKEKYMVLQGPAGCVDKDTEYLTPTGWKFLSDYTVGDEILQWHPSGTTEFVKPSAYIKAPAKSLTSFKTKNVDMVLSATHKVPYITSKGFHGVKLASNISKLSAIKLPRSFSAPILTGIVLSDALIKVLIMQTADGYLTTVGTKVKVFINVKKERKQLRVAQLLKAANIEYKIHKGMPGYMRFAYCPPTEIAFKNIQCLWGAHEKQLKLAIEEIPLWDGSITQRTNVQTISFTGNKRDADLVQYIYSTVSGNYASVRKDPRKYKNESIYDVKLSSRNSSIVSFKDTRPSRNCTPTEVKTKDGFQYCFTTPSAFWLARRNGKIFPTGNSGKSFLIRHLLDTFQAEYKAWSIL
ncbi:MAG: hypothetical protein PF450_11910, partial [Bacteroidales bacterium]|nr:hypothetical protein [Bacteroidales bacterium]